MGVLTIDGVFRGFTLENTFTFSKSEGSSAIPPGTYPVTQKRVLTPMTKRYKAKYDWFEYFYEVQDIPDFTDVYFHIGNTVRDTAGCILVGKSLDTEAAYLGKSTQAMYSLHEYLDMVEPGEEIVLTIE